jgi:hypothetical protein
MCLVIADECDGQLKSHMQKTFRRMRTKRQIKPGENVSKRLFHIHDSMYFGSSKDSVGLQIADAANWAMRRYLGGEEIEPRMIEQLKKFSICATHEPEWSEHRKIFRNHMDLENEIKR